MMQYRDYNENGDHLKQMSYSGVPTHTFVYNKTPMSLTPTPHTFLNQENIFHFHKKSLGFLNWVVIVGHPILQKKIILKKS